MGAMKAMPAAMLRGAERCRKGKLLVVDDQTAIRRSLRITLERMDFEISEAGTGEQGHRAGCDGPFRRRASGYRDARDGRY